MVSTFSRKGEVKVHVGLGGIDIPQTNMPGTSAFFTGIYVYIYIYFLSHVSSQIYLSITPRYYLK